MKHSKEIKWLYQQFPSLIQKGIISEETANQLREHYGPVEDKPSYNIAFIIAAILGALLIGAGIILIFAYNWENFSRPVRTFLSFLPLIIAQLIYGFVFFKKRESTAWTEGSSIFLMLMLAACISLVSQTYHIQGEMEDFLLTWALLSIPLMYLMNSTLCAILFLVVIASFAVNMRGTESVYYWGLLAAVIPHFYLNYQEQNHTRTQLTGWTLAITLAVAFWGVVEPEVFPRTMIWVATLLSLFYIFGNIVYEKKGFVKRPFQSFVIGAIFIFTLFLAATWDAGDSIDWNQFVEGDNFAAWGAVTNFVIFILTLIIFILMIPQQLKRDYTNYFVLIFPFLVFSDVLLRSSEQSYVAAIIANIFLFAFGIYYINKGIKGRTMGEVNLGMLFVISLIVSRFFDTDWSAVVKGVIFVILGIGFLTVNLVLSKKLKSETS